MIPTIEIVRSIGARGWYQWLIVLITTVDTYMNDTSSHCRAGEEVNSMILEALQWVSLTQLDAFLVPSVAAADSSIPRQVNQGAPWMPFGSSVAID